MEALYNLFHDDINLSYDVDSLFSFAVHMAYLDVCKTLMILSNHTIDILYSGYNLFEEAIRTVCQHDRASASLLQRRLSIGYSRAARILDQLEEAGIVGHAEGSKPRDVLIRNADEIINSLNQ